MPHPSFAARLATTCALLAAPSALAAGPDTGPFEQAPHPVPTMQAVSVEQSIQTVPTFAPGGPPLAIYMHRWGGTYTGGWDNSANNVSSIVNGTAQVSAFSGSDAQWNAIMSCVQDQFSAFNAYVTDVEPTSGSYIESVVGGTPGQVGLPNGVGGVAPWDPYGCNIIDKAIVYTFSAVYMNGGNPVQAICETATQEIAHALTLDHAYLCEDPMTYLNGCGPKTFQNVNAQCGEYQPRECSCNGTTQNSVQILLNRLGPNTGVEPPDPIEDNGPPVATITSPGNGATFSVGDTLNIVAQVTDDTQLTEVQLYWANNDVLLGCPGSGNGWSCNQSGSTFTWQLTPGAGQRSFYVHARDIVGNVTDTGTVTVTFTEGGVEPPPVSDDTVPPMVAILSPQAGSEQQANSVIEVVVSASDDEGVAAVTLDWLWSGDTFGCPMQNQAVTCTVEGSVYTWNINVGSGQREFFATVTDTGGNEVSTPTRSITLVDNPAPPVTDDAYEENDTWNQATGVACGDQLDLVAVGGDDDWFRLQVPTDDHVRFEVNGAVAMQLEMQVHESPGSLLAESEGVGFVELTPLVPEIGLKVSLPVGQVGDYSLNVLCEPVAGQIDPPDDPGTDDPGTDDPGTDDPGTDDPGTDDPGTDDPGTDDPGLDDPGLDDPSLDDDLGRDIGGGGCSAQHTSGSLPAGGVLALIGLALVVRRRRR